MNKDSEGSVAGLVALLFNARVVSVFKAQRQWGRSLLTTCTFAASSDIPCVVPFMKPQPWEKILDSMLLWFWTGFLALVSKALSVGTYIVFTMLAMYTHRVRRWYLEGAPDALLEGYLGCCGNIRHHCINRCESQLFFRRIVRAITAGLS